MPTTVIGLIDASVSIKVAVNYGRYKNRLGAYHAPMHTFLDFTLLQTLPRAQVRNGFAELIKISSCSHLEVFELLDQFCEQLIDTKFGRAEGSPDEVRKAADIVSRGLCIRQAQSTDMLTCADHSGGHLRDAEAGVTEST